MNEYYKGEKLKLFTYVAGACSIVSLGLMIVLMIIEHPELSKQLVFLIPLLPFFVFLYLFLHLSAKQFRFDELSVIYSLELDLEGNALIQRETTFVNSFTSSVKERAHIIYSSGTPIDWSKINIETWDGEGHSLPPPKLLNDKPTYKSFLISFYRPIKPKEVYTYGYRFRCEKMFPDKEEWFDGHDTCRKNVYKLKLPKNINLRQIFCQELTRSHETKPCHEIRREVIPTNDCFQYLLEILKTERFNKTKILWEIG